MSFLSDAIDKELELLHRIRENMSGDMIRPQKAVIISKHPHNRDYFYKVEYNNGRSTHAYLGNSDSKKLKYTVQAAYKQALENIVRHDIDLLTSFKRNYTDITERVVTSRLSPCVKNISPSENYLPDFTELRAWAAENYKKNTTPFGHKVIRAKDGTRVRSKSECIIYNALLDAGIPFRYDPILSFKYKNRYGEFVYKDKAPDFQIKCPDGSFILIEHGGLIESSDYSEDLLSKIRLYILNGYILGYSFFVTGDSVDGGIDSFEIDKIIHLISSRFSMI